MPNLSGIDLCKKLKQQQDAPYILLLTGNNQSDDLVHALASGADDYLAKPFGVMPHLMAMAEYVTKVHAICMQCGSVAQYSYRYSRSGTQVQLGEKDAYEPRCRKCFVIGMEEQLKGKDI